MKHTYSELGIMLHDLRSQRDLSQEDVLKEIKEDWRVDDRTWRRYEAGQSCPPKKVLLPALVKAFKLTDAMQVRPALQMAGYELTPEDIRRYSLSMSEPKPQETLWGPNVGKGPGILISNSATGEFIPWTKTFETELERGLLSQLGGHIPPGCRLGLGDYKGRQNWLTLIINPEGKRTAEIWFGTDPDNQWRYDGLVRAGDDTYVVWQVFQRYSDGTYRRIRKQLPRARTQSSSV